MALDYVTLVLDLYTPQGAPLAGGKAVFTPSSALTDVADLMVIAAQPVSVPFTGSMPPQVQLLATDNGNPQPNGWTWGVSFTAQGAPQPFSFYLPAGPAAFSATSSSATITWTAGGGLMSLPVGTGVRLSGDSLPGGFSAGTTYYVVASSGLTVQLATTPGGSAITAASTGSGSLTVVQRNLSSIAPVVPQVPAAVQYLQQPAGTPSAGLVVTATGPGSWEWAEPTGGGGGGAVSSVFGRSGAVTAQSGDYTASQVSGAVQIGGDLEGTAGAPEVGKIQGTSIGSPTGSPTQYLDAQGNWTTPAGTGGSMSNPMSASGDTIYGGASGSPQRLAGNTSATKKYLTQTGDGTNSAGPAWVAIAAADLPGATTSAQGAIQLGGGTVNFLRADGTWAATPGGAISTVFGRTGAVVPVSGDYTAGQVTGAVQVGGDLGGTAAAPTVAKLQGTTLAAPSGGTTHFLNASGGWTVPSGGGSSGVTGWKNLVGDYGADNTGATSIATPLANAMAAATAAQPAPFGLMVPPGFYKMTAHQDLPYNLVMQGAGDTGGDVTGQYGGSVFQVASSFSGSYVFGYQDTPHVSGMTGTNGAIVTGIYVDGGAYTGGSAIDGFYIYGPTMCTFENIKIARMTGWAINASGVDSSMAESFPFGQTWTNVQADSCGTVSGGGFNLNGCEDSVFLSCYSIGNNNGPGFQVNGCDNTKFTSCNAEWNSNYGFYITGDWQWFTGGCQFVNCSTDANNNAGLYVDATWTTGGGAGTGPGIIMFTGCHFRRDGQAGSGNTAGIYIAATTLPVIINGFSTMPSIGDIGGGTEAPKYGVYFSQTSYTQPLMISNGLAWGVTAAANHNGTAGFPTTSSVFSSSNVLLAHGNNYAPTYGS